MNLFGKNRSKSQKKSSRGKASGTLSFNRIQVLSKLDDLDFLLKVVKEDPVSAEVSRQKLKAASLVSGRGEATIHSYTKYKFKNGPRPVLVLSFPRSTKGGNFVPVDNPMEIGEAIELRFKMALPQTDSLFFTAKTSYLQTAIFIPNIDDPNKHWVGSREATEKQFGAGGLKQGEEVLQLRVDQITVFPHPPETFSGDQIAPYIFSPELYVIGGGGVWAKRGGNGYFDSIPDTLEKYLKKIEEKKIMNRVQLIDFGVDEISMFVSQNPITGIEHDFLVPSVLKNPNANLQNINTACGFLLKFKIAEEIKELLMRTFSQKVGKESEIWLPLTLGQIVDASAPKFRLLFQLFPRDLTQEVNPQRRKKFPGIKFLPPFMLHPNAEDQNTYRKLMVAIGQRMKDDARPEDEKNKLAAVQAQVAKQREETRGKYVDENLQKAFRARQQAKKRQDF